MENINFAGLYKFTAERIGRIPDDELGSAIGQYFGKTPQCARVTRKELAEKGFDIHEIQNGFSCENSKSRELMRIEKEIAKLEKQRSELLQPHFAIPAPSLAD